MHQHVCVRTLVFSHFTKVDVQSNIEWSMMEDLQDFSAVWGQDKTTLSISGWKMIARISLRDDK